MPNTFKPSEYKHGAMEFSFIQCVHVGAQYDEWLALRWCCEQFGGVTGERWDLHRGMFFFRDRDDAFAFKMRWC